MATKSRWFVCKEDLEGADAQLHSEKIIREYPDDFEDLILLEVTFGNEYELKTEQTVVIQPITAKVNKRG